MFSLGIFKSNFKRFWIIPVVITIILFLTITFQMITETNQIEKYPILINDVVHPEYSSTTTDNTIDITGSVNAISNSLPVVQNIEETTSDLQKEYNEQVINNYTRRLIRTLYTPVNIAIIFILPIIISILVFGYSNEEKSSSFIHGLPISKKRLYITNIITAIIMYVIPYLINLIILLLLNQGDMGKYLQSIEIYKWFGVCILYNTVFFSFSTIVGSICASKISHGIFTYVLMYAPVLVVILLNQILEDILYGFNGIQNQIENIQNYTPFINIIQNFQNMQYYYSEQVMDLQTKSIIIYIIVSIIMLISGYFIYKKRKLEITKEFIAFKPVRTIIKYCGTLCVNLLAYVYFYNVFDDKLSGMIGAIIITLIGYFIIEMILKKTYKVFKSIKGFIVYAVIINSLYLIIYNGAFGFDTRIPKVDDVQQVTISKYGQEIILNEKQNIQNIIDLHKELIQNRTDSNSSIYVIEYKFDNGMKMSRKYSIREKDYKKYIQNLVTSNEYYEKTTNDLEEANSIKINFYKGNRYTTITIKDNEKSKFIQDLKLDIKNNKAAVSSIFNSSIIQENNQIMDFTVQVNLKDTTKYIRYNDSSISNSNIEKYINYSN